MFVDKLAVVNACLGTLGETPLNTLEDDHSYKAASLNYLLTASQEIQGLGLWFNSERLCLDPDGVSKFIYIPNDVIEIRSMHYRGLSFAQRGRRLYNTAHNTYEFSDSVYVHVIRLLEYEDLPFKAAAAIRDIAVMRFQEQYDGDTVRFRELQAQATRTFSEMKAEDTRQRKPNLLARTSVQRILSASQTTGLIWAEVPSQLR